MENNKKKEETTDNHFTKRIGKTTCQATVHFSKTSKETLRDKIHRLIKNECSDIGTKE